MNINIKKEKLETKYTINISITELDTKFDETAKQEKEKSNAFLEKLKLWSRDDTYYSRFIS